MNVTPKESIPAFSEFAKEELLEGEKIKLDSVVGKEIVVLSYRLSNSKFTDSKTGNYVTIQIEIESEKKVIFTASGVLSDQCKRYEKQMPFRTTIKKIQKYYTFT